jgi:hypothetical protein
LTHPFIRFILINSLFYMGSRELLPVNIQAGERMGRFVIKAALGFFIFFIVVSITIALALPTVLSSDFARQKIEHSLSRELQKPVSIEKIEFSWSEGIAVSNFVSVNEDQTPFITLPSLKLLLSWPSLLSGKLDIVTLDVKGIDVTITRGGKDRTVVSDVPEAVSQDVLPTKVAEPSGGGLPDLFLNARIEDGNFSFIDKLRNTVTRIRNLNADIDLPSLNEPLNLALKADVLLNDNPPESIELSGTALFAHEGEVNLKKGIGSLEMKAGFGTANLFFDLAQMETSKDATGARLSCALDLQKLTQLAAAIVGLPPEFSLKGSLKSDFEARGNMNEQVAIDGKTELVNLSVKGGPLKNATFKQPRIALAHDIALNFDTMLADITAVSLKSDFLDLALSGVVKDFQEDPSGKLIVSGSGSLNDIVLVFGKILSLPPDLKLSGNVNLALTGEGDLDKVAIKGTVDCKNLEVSADFLNNYPFRETSLKLTPNALITLDDKTTSVVLNSVNIQSGIFSGDIKGTLDSEVSVDLTAKLSTSLSLLGQNLRGVLPDSFPKEGQLLSDLTIRGNLDQTLAVKGNHTINKARVVLQPAPDERTASAAATTLSLPKLAVVHDVDYQGDKDNISLKSLEVDSSFGTIKAAGILSRLSKDLLTEATGELALEMGEVTKLIKGLLPEGFTMNGKGEITFTFNGSLSPPDDKPLLAEWNGDGSLKIASADYTGIGSLKNLHTKNLSLVKGVLDTTLDCQLNGGPSQVVAKCDFSKERPDVQVTIDARKVNLSQDLTLLGYIIPILITSSEGTLSGKVDVSAQASWQGFEWDSEISRTIDGKGSLSVSEGTVRSRNILAEILKFAGESEKLEFEQILTGFRLSDGKVYNDDIQVNGETLDFNLKGWTSLVYIPSKQGNPLEYTVTGDWIDKSLGRDAKKVLSVLGGGETIIPIVIAGTVQKPRVTIKKPKIEDVFKGFLKSRQKEK